jgi:hypothetical protein
MRAGSVYPEGCMRHPLAVVTITILLIRLCFPAGVAAAQPVPLIDLLPGYPEGGSLLSVIDDGERTLDEHAASFADPAEAAQLLPEWGWQANAYRFFEAPPAPGDAVPPYLYVSVTRFRDADGAAAALPYIIRDLAAEIGHREIPTDAAVGDEVRQFVAPIDGGTDLTLYVRSGALVMRISMLLTEGGPIADPAAIAEDIIAAQSAPRPTAVPRPSILPLLLDVLPPDLPACLRDVGQEDLDFAALVDRFPMVPDADEQLRALGWEAGAYRQFACETPPATGLNWVDMSVHRFADAASAAAAVPFFANARTLGTQLYAVPATGPGDATAAIFGPSELGTESTLYASSGPLLLRVTGIDRGADPTADTALVMTALYLRNTGAVAGAHQIAAQAVSDPTSAPTPPPSEPAPRASATLTEEEAIYGAQPAPVAAETPEPEVPPLPECDPSYPDVCIPPVWEVGDLDCRDVPYARFRVVGDDPHRFDGPYDGSIPNEPDGIGCEWN